MSFEARYRACLKIAFVEE